MFSPVEGKLGWEKESEKYAAMHVCRQKLQQVPKVSAFLVEPVWAPGMFAFAIVSCPTSTPLRRCGSCCMFSESGGQPGRCVPRYKLNVCMQCPKMSLG